MENKPEKIKYSDVQTSTLFVVVVASLITSFVGSATNICIPDMSAAFSVGVASIGWVVSAYMLPVAGFSVPFGRLADITCRKTVLVIGLVIFAIAGFICAAAQTFGILIAARVLQAIGSAMIFSTNHAVLITEFPGKDRGKVLGYALASTYIGLSAGPAAGGIINHYIGWRSIFIMTGVLGLVAAIIAAKKLPKRILDNSREKFDMAGNILYIVMILLIIYGLNEFSQNRWAMILVLIGIILGIIFVRREKNIESPLVDVMLFVRNKSYTLSNLAALLNYAATYAIGYLLSIYLQVVAGFSSQTAGLILISQPFFMALLSPTMGRLSDSISPFKLASGGMVLCAISLIMLAFISVSTPVWVIILVLCITGIGFAMFSSPNTNAVMSCIDKESFGVASSVLSTMRNLGHNMSMVIVTLIISFNLGNVAMAEADPAAIVSTMRIAYVFFSAICVVGVFASMQRKDKKKDMD